MNVKIKESLKFLIICSLAGVTLMGCKKKEEALPALEVTKKADVTAAESYRVNFLNAALADGSSGTLATMAGIDITLDDQVYFYGLSGLVTIGNSTLIYGPTTSYVLAPGKAYSDVIDVAVSKSNYYYVWYKDGTMSVGSATNLGNYIGTKPFLMPSGKTPADIVGVAITKVNDYVYTWYKDGTASVGNSTDLGAYRAPYAYSLPPGKTFTDIVDVGIAGSSSWVYAWYSNGTMSVGTSDDLDYYIPLKPMN